MPLFEKGKDGGGLRYHPPPFYMMIRYESTREGGGDLATPSSPICVTLCDRGSYRRWGLKASPPPYHLVNILAARRCEAFTWIKGIIGKLLSAQLFIIVIYAL